MYEAAFRGCSSLHRSEGRQRGKGQQVGPCGSVRNFAAEMAWLEPAGWMRRESTAELVEAIEALWADPEGARLQGEGLRAAVVAHAGVSGRIATRILQLARIDV